MTPIKLLRSQTEPTFPFWKNRLFEPIIAGRLQTFQKQDLKKADLIKFSRPQVIAVFGYSVGSYAETAYPAQSEIYDRVYVLAGLSFGLVNGLRYRTAIIGARFRVKLWLQEVATFAAGLPGHGGEKASTLEELGRFERNPPRLDLARDEQNKVRQERHDQTLRRGMDRGLSPEISITGRVAELAFAPAARLNRVFDRIVARTGVREDDFTGPERCQNPPIQTGNPRGPEP